LSREKKYHKFTAEDIEKYHKGLLSPREMNELEKAALDDAFLADALEGYAAVSVNAAEDLSELEKRLKQKIAGAKVVSMHGRSLFRWWKVAAAVVIIAGFGFFAYWLSTSTSSKEVAKVESKPEQKKTPGEQPKLSIPAGDSTKASAPGTISVANSVRQKKMNGAGTPQQQGTSRVLLDRASDTTNKGVAANASAPVTIEPLDVKTEKDESSASPRSTPNSREDFAKTKMPTQENRKSAAPSAMQRQEIAVMDQQKKNYFRGRVVDENNNPLPFANITNAKDNAGTYADVNGNFTLLSPDSTLDVQVRSVGFENNLARLKNNVASNQVTLQETKTLKETAKIYKQADNVTSGVSATPLEEAEPVDGWSNYNLYLANNINVPADLKKKTAGGQVQLSFDINQSGSPIDVRVEKSLSKKSDEEAIRVVRDGPKWMRKSKTVGRVMINVPFNSSR